MFLNFGIERLRNRQASVEERAFVVLRFVGIPVAHILLGELAGCSELAYVVVLAEVLHPFQRKRVYAFATLVQVTRIVVLPRKQAACSQPKLDRKSVV